MTTIYQEITSTIIQALENARDNPIGDFQMPWHSSAMVNVSSNKAYRGINPLLLAVSSAKHGYAAPQWGTYRQWAEIGAQVRKGEKATKIYFFRTLIKEDQAGNEKAIPCPKSYSVFNADQVDGYTPPETGHAANYEDLKIEAAINLIEAQNAAIDFESNDARAYYSPMADKINMPKYSLFTGTKTSTAAECYYSTVFHELAHWTGHASRLNRFKTGEILKNDKRADYAFEELIAELGAAYVCQAIGMTGHTRADHIQYINSWLKALRSDTKFIWQAASQAQKATDYLLANARMNVMAEEVAA